MLTITDPIQKVHPWVWPFVNETDIAQTLLQIVKEVGPNDTSTGFNNNRDFHQYLGRALRIPNFKFTAAHWTLLVKRAQDALGLSPEDGKYLTVDIARNPFGATVMHIATYLAATFGKAYAYSRLRQLSDASSYDCIDNDIAERATFSMLISEGSTLKSAETLYSSILRKSYTPGQVIAHIKLAIKGDIRAQLDRLSRRPNPESIFHKEYEDDDSNQFDAPDTSGVFDVYQTIQLEHLLEFFNRIHDDLTLQEQQILQVWMRPDAQELIKKCETFHGQFAAIASLAGLTKYQAIKLAKSIIEKFHKLLQLKFSASIETRKVIKNQSLRYKIARGMHVCGTQGRQPEMTTTLENHVVFDSRYVTFSDAQLLFKAVGHGVTILKPNDFALD